MLHTVTAPGRLTKAQVRARVQAVRSAMDQAERERAASLLTVSLLDLPDLVSARCVAAYVSFGTEPSSAELLAALSSREVRVLLPVLRDDLDLDWAIYDVRSGLRQGRQGTAEPAGPTLGVEAISEADLVVVPALAVGADGTRLGRGGGSYDRALARVREDSTTVALLYDDELLPDVPAEAHDRRVDVVVQPSGTHRFGPVPGAVT
jgi:5-formyltetrahydrofolate cyclo-ligase